MLVLPTSIPRGAKGEVNSIGNIAICPNNPENYGFDSNIGNFLLFLNATPFPPAPSEVLGVKLIVSGISQFNPEIWIAMNLTLILVVLCYFYMSHGCKG